VISLKGLAVTFEKFRKRIMENIPASILIVRRTFKIKDDYQCAAHKGRGEWVRDPDLMVDRLADEYQKLVKAARKACDEYNMRGPTKHAEIECDKAMRKLHDLLPREESDRKNE
jgi:hypothetical protein